ncbi:MAG: peptidoglycan editing factor PgeF [Syntrophomonadaceae bacterium]|jgi:YfiH family protein|nr:peptidoglycan editing factor PgeF [Syntrophomonadaceae bacterium]
MNWEWKPHGSLSFLELPGWNELGVIAAFTARNGGFSAGPFKSLNLGLHVGDNPELVMANRDLVGRSLGFGLDRMVCCEQVHGREVAVVNRRHAGRGAYSLDDALKGCDAMVTNTSGVFLTAFFADCFPLYFFDPVKRVVALAHSGWKGTALRIAEATLKVMKSEFGCRSKDILVFIGPGIGPECFGINAQRKNQVEGLFTFSDKIIYSYNENRFVWDLELTNRLILKESGIPEENIESCHLCTSCHQDQFFSYRASGGRTGRMAAVLSLLE